MLIIIYIDDILITGRRKKEVESTRDTFIYLLQYLGFLLNLKKSVLQPCEEIEYLGLIVNSVNLTLSLSLHKVQKVQEECTKMYNRNWTSMLELTKLLGLFSPTIQTVALARLQIWKLQQLQMHSLKLKKPFQLNVKLTASVKEELLLWMSKLKHSNGKFCIQNHLDQVLIQTDVSKNGWRVVCKGVRTGACVVKGGTTASYQCPKISIKKTRFVDIHQVRINQINSLSKRQQNNNFLSFENRGHSK